MAFFIVAIKLIYKLTQSYPVKAETSVITLASTATKNYAVSLQHHSTNHSSRYIRVQNEMTTATTFAR